MEIKEKIDALTSELRGYQDAYYKEGKSLVSDLEYDKLTDELIALEKEYPEYAHPDSPTRRVGSDLTEDFPEVEHTIPVLSLDKAYSGEEILSFFDKSISKGGDGISFVAEEKIDGVSMVLYYEKGILVRAVTRGNGFIGNDVTPNVQTMFDVPLSLSKPIDIAVRGEVYIDKADFEAFNRGLKESEKAANPRNLAAGTVRRKSGGSRAPLHMWCYEGFWAEGHESPDNHLMILSELRNLGIRINPHIALFSGTKEGAEKRLKEAGLEGEGYSFSEIGDYIERRTKERAGLPYEIDGLVFKIDDVKTREKLGYTEHHPRWAIAYKFESPEGRADLLGITVQVGRTGRITPVAEITPTKIGGSTVTRATLHNQEYINELELAIGDTVTVSKHGDVIPAVERVIEKNNSGNTTFVIPSECPSCGKPITKIGGLQYCENYECRDRVIDRITFFASADQMDIETLGPSKVELLYDAGLIKDVGDIYSLNEENLSSVFPTTKMRENLLKGIEKSRERPFSTVLSSLGVAEIGKKKAAVLIKGGYDDIDKLISASVENLVSLQDVGELGAKSIVEAFSEEHLLKIIEKLRIAGLHLKEEASSKESEAEQIFSGEVWCITGSLEFGSRQEAFAEIEKRGGRTVTSVTSKTTHLLAGKGGGGKRRDAEKYGTKIVSESEFLERLGKSDS